MSAPIKRKELLKEFIFFLMLFSFFIPENIYSQFCNNGTSSESIIVTQTIQTTTENTRCDNKQGEQENTQAQQHKTAQ